jgi:uncharacterized protein (TIGR03084 family)
LALVKAALDELRAEFDDIDQVLEDLVPERWLNPTPAAGWDIRDQVSHLADTNEICVDTITGGPRPLNETAMSYPSPEAFTESGCERGRAMAPPDVFAWWRASCHAVLDALASKQPNDRIPWGLGMSARMMATARLMEHWAHSADIRGALGMGPSVTPRLHSIAFLIVRAVPYALGVAKVPPPPGTLRAELSYDGETWHFGPDDADSVITGEALEFCLLGVQRTTIDKVHTLKASGPLAEAALPNLRAFL